MSKVLLQSKLYSTGVQICEIIGELHLSCCDVTVKHCDKDTMVILETTKL